MPTTILVPNESIPLTAMYCEVCERNYRLFLCRFADGTGFMVCRPCTDDLKTVVEIFGIAVAISGLRE